MQFPHSTELMRAERDEFPFVVFPELTGAAAPGARGEPGMDQWWIRIREELYGGEMSIGYSTGVGLRENGKPSAPVARRVLACIGLDLAILDECPEDDGAALDYLMAEYGHDKASDALDALRTLRRMRDDAADMLRGTGLTVAEWAEWCRSLDS